jgi:hypothetical protein
MRINDLLTENQQLDEGPLGTVGKAIGKGVGGLAKGVGAVAGGVAGLGSALKKGYQSGKATVTGEPDPNAQTATAGTTAAQPAAQQPAAGAPPAATAQQPTAATAQPAAGAAPTTQQINKAGPKGTAPATAQTGAAAQALAKTAQATQGAGAAKAGQTLYAQVKASVNQLDKKGKQRIMQLLQKSLTAPDATAQQPAATPPAATTAPAAPAAEPTATTVPTAEPAATTAPAAEPAVEPAATTTKAKGGKVAGQQSQTPNAIRKRNARRDKANAAATTGGASAFNQMSQQLSQQNSSKDNYGTALKEMLADRLAMHKQRMFESSLVNGTASVFKK